MAVPDESLLRSLEDEIKGKIAEHKEKGVQYTDSEFPATEASLWRDGQARDDDPRLEIPHSWTRASEVCGPDAVVFDRENPGGVSQGSLGSCALFDALLTWRNHLEENLVAYDVDVGIYTVRFFVNGDWVFVTVDDYIPTRQTERGTTIPIFGASTNHSETWVMIFEKAYAKLFGSYEHIDGGIGHYALVDVSGGALTRFPPQRKRPIGGVNLFGDYLFTIHTGGDKKKSRFVAKVSFCLGHIYGGGSDDKRGDFGFSGFYDSTANMELVQTWEDGGETRTFQGTYDTHTRSVVGSVRQPDGHMCEFELSSCEIMDELYELTPFSSLWETVRIRLHEGYVAVMTARGEATDDKPDSITGLFKGRTYTILEEVVINSAQLFKVDNSLHSEVWHGEWSNRSPKWTEAARIQQDYSRNDDSVFYIHIDDVCQFFGSVDVVRAVPYQWRYVAHLVKMTKRATDKINISTHSLGVPDNNTANTNGAHSSHTHSATTSRSASPNHDVDATTAHTPLPTDAASCLHLFSRTNVVISVSQLSSRANDGVDFYPVSVGFDVYQCRTRNCDSSNFTQQNCVKVCSIPPIGERSVGVELTLEFNGRPYIIVPTSDARTVTIPLVVAAHADGDVALTPLEEKLSCHWCERDIVYGYQCKDCYFDRNICERCYWVEGWRGASADGGHDPNNHVLRRITGSALCCEGESCRSGYAGQPIPEGAFLCLTCGGEGGKKGGSADVIMCEADKNHAQAPGGSHAEHKFLRLNVGLTCGACRHEDFAGHVTHCETCGDYCMCKACYRLGLVKPGSRHNYKHEVRLVEDPDSDLAMPERTFGSDDDAEKELDSIEFPDVGPELVLEVPRDVRESWFQTWREEGESTMNAEDLTQNLQRLRSHHTRASARRLSVEYDGAASDTDDGPIVTREDSMHKRKQIVDDDGPVVVNDSGALCGRGSSTCVIL